VTEHEPQPAVEEWTAPGPDDAASAAEALVIDIEGFEGPLDLLLALARTQKVDIARISILALVEQYLTYIHAVQRIKLEIAADYLVMAAWLAFLKSRLLLPREKTDDNSLSGEELAQRLAFRLMRLDAMRKAAAQLLTRRRLGRDVFARGAPEGVKTIRETEYTAQIYDLLQAYAVQRTRTIKQVHVVKQRTVWSIKEARRYLQRLVGGSAGEWVQLDLFLETYMPAGATGGEIEKTVVASSFGASLEMARDGLLEIKQDAPFAPIYMRKRGSGATWEKIG
jgi:segregation and condensation protein A